MTGERGTETGSKEHFLGALEVNRQHDNWPMFWYYASELHKLGEDAKVIVTPDDIRKTKDWLNWYKKNKEKIPNMESFIEEMRRNIKKLGYEEEIFVEELFQENQKIDQKVREASELLSTAADELSTWGENYKKTLAKTDNQEQLSTILKSLAPLIEALREAIEKLKEAAGKGNHQYELLLDSFDKQPTLEGKAKAWIDWESRLFGEKS